jgi:imidazolonepropionase-like amidohydrolase
MTDTLFTRVNVLDCSGKPPFAGEVLVRRNRIVRVCRGPAALPREGVRVVDGRGTATLMPGLIESHAHLSFENTDDLARIGRIPPEETTLMATRNAKFYLVCCIMSCLSAAAAKPRVGVVIRNAINAGEIPGPRLVDGNPLTT